MKSAVIDTNVLLVANNRSPQTGPDCVVKAVARLRKVQKGQLVALDSLGRIFDEYLRQRLSFSGQPGFGDAIFKWIFENQFNNKHVEQVEIHPTQPPAENYEEFPADPRLLAFDASDRKFAAVARVSEHQAQVINAVDSDWWDYREPLQENGVLIEFICPEQFSGRP